MRMRFLRAWIAALALGGLPSSTVAAQEQVDLLLYNGKVFTADATKSIHQAVAIRDNRIVAVGGNALAERYSAVRTVDLEGRLVTPGFNDTHIHVRGNPGRYIDFAGTSSIEEFMAKVKAKAEELGPGEWVTGYGWSEDEFAEKRNPTRWDLDEAAFENPVIITRAGGHSSVANSLALEIAGVDENTPQPEHGLIERDSRGRLNGIIREAAGMVSRFVPGATTEELRGSLIANLEALPAKGITSIILAGNSPSGFAEWKAIYDERWGTLPRATVQIRPSGDSPEEMVAGILLSGLLTGQGDERIRVGAIKIFVDGGYTGPAAWTLEHYRDQPDYYGYGLHTNAALHEIVKGLHEAGWQMGFHAIGDAAIVQAVNVFARVLDETPRYDHRHYLNHFTVTPPEETLRRMAEYNIHVSQQPNFTYSVEGRYVRNLTEDRAAHNNPVKTVTDHGIFMAFASDILPIDPRVGLYAAVTRKGMSGKAYAPEDEAISMADAITAYTRNAAYLTWEEDIKGTIEPGKLADLVVLSEDLLTIDPERTMEVDIDLTVIDGKVVYERPRQTTLR